MSGPLLMLDYMILKSRQIRPDLFRGRGEGVYRRTGLDGRYSACQQLRIDWQDHNQRKWEHRAQQGPATSQQNAAHRARPWFWIATSIKRKASTPPALAYDVRSAVGRRARKTAGLVAAGIHGTRSKQEECAPLVSTSGLPRSVSRVPASRRSDWYSQ
jgi:hypothetical protein